MKNIKPNNDLELKNTEQLIDDSLENLLNIQGDCNEDEEEPNFDMYESDNNDEPHIKEYFTQEEKELRALEDMKLPHYVASRMSSYNVDYEELVGIAWYGYTKALNSFDKSRNVKFATYAVNCMRNEIFYVLRKEKKHSDNNTSLHKVLAMDKNGNGLELGDLLAEELSVNETQSVEDALLQSETNDLLFRALSYLKKQEQVVLMYRYGLNNYPKKTQKEVAELIGMSQANVSKMEKSCLLKLKLFLKKDMTEY